MRRKVELFFLFVDFFCYVDSRRDSKRGFQSSAGEDLERNGERSLRGEFVQAEGPHGLERSQFANSTVGQC